MAERDAAELARLRAKVAYWSDKEHINRPKDEMLKFETDFVGEVEILNPLDARFGEKISVPFYKAGTVGDILDKSTQTVRLWERQGTIPSSGFALKGAAAGRENRGYTYDQVRALMDLVPLLNFSDDRGMEYTAFSRALWKAWAQMPDGVVVEPKGRGKPEEKTTTGRKRRGSGE